MTTPSQKCLQGLQAYEIKEGDTIAILAQQFRIKAEAYDIIDNHTATRGWCVVNPKTREMKDYLTP